MDRTYTGSYGRLKVLNQEFFSDEFIISLMDKNADEVLQTLSAGPYKEDIDSSSAFASGLRLAEVAINRHLIKKNRLAIQAPPPASRKFLEVYFSKWDIENVKTVISAKFLGHDLRETEDFILSFRDVPSGIFGGRMGKEEFRSLMSLGSVEAVVESISRFPFGVRAMQTLDQYRKTNDPSVLFTAMDNFYLEDVLSSLKFFNGDEGAVRRYFRDLVDLKNMLLVMKARELGLNIEMIIPNVLPGGFVSVDRLEEIFRIGSSEEAIRKASDALSVQNPDSSGSLTDFELASENAIYMRSIDSITGSAPSLSSIFAFILKSEREREHLRIAILGKSAGISRERLIKLIGAKGG